MHKMVVQCDGILVLEPLYHHEKLLIPATGIVPSGTREYEDTFPCWLLLFPCTSLKNHIPVLHTGIDISYRLV